MNLIRRRWNFSCEEKKRNGQSTPVSKTGMVLNKMERNKVWHITPSI